MAGLTIDAPDQPSSRTVQIYELHNEIGPALARPLTAGRFRLLGAVTEAGTAVDDARHTDGAGHRHEPAHSDRDAGPSPSSKEPSAAAQRTAAQALETMFNATNRDRPPQRRRTQGQL